jgi:predicted nucleotide-binding protein
MIFAPAGSTERGAKPNPRNFDRNIDMPRRPTAFIASASSQLPFAKRVRIGLRRNVDCTIWSEGFYEPGHYVLDDLAAKGDRFDYAIFFY